MAKTKNIATSSSKLAKLRTEREKFNPESRRLIDELSFTELQIEKIGSMQKSEGWKIVSSKLRLAVRSTLKALLAGEHKDLADVIRRTARANAFLEVLEAANADGDRQSLDSLIEELTGAPSNPQR